MQETLDAKDAGNRKQTGRFEALVASQQESWQARKSKFYDIREDVDAKMNQKFKDMLRTGRNWRGTVTVDHNERQVMLSVTPHKGALPCLAARAAFVANEGIRWTYLLGRARGGVFGYLGTATMISGPSAAVSAVPRDCSI